MFYFQVFEDSPHFSIVAASTYNPTNSTHGFPFLHILSSACWFLDDGRSDRCEGTSHCGLLQPHMLRCPSWPERAVTKLPDHHPPHWVLLDEGERERYRVVLGATAAGAPQSFYGWWLFLVLGREVLMNKPGYVTGRARATPGWITVCLRPAQDSHSHSAQL